MAENVAEIEAYCKMEKLPCNSDKDGYKDHFQVLDIEWKAAYEYDPKSNKARSEPVMGGLMITKLVDRASPQLAECVAYKFMVDKVALIVIEDKPGSGGRDKFFKIELEKCRVISIEWSATGLSGHKHMHGGQMVERIGIVGQINKWEELFNSKKGEFDFFKPDSKKAL